VVDGIKKMISHAEQVSPKGVKIRLLDDASTFVKDSISDVVHEMAMAGVLVGLIVLMLLGSWRATAIVWTSIPLSILTAIIGLHVLNETINVMTLGGLALAVGILVDNATVVIENIDRHLAMDKPLEQAIIDATKQIVLPTFVATLCIAIVWYPLFELGGVAGYLFKPMAEAVIIAMLASFVLSFTLVPTMPSPYDQHGQPDAEPSRNVFVRYQKEFERRFNQFRQGYGTLLEQVIVHRRAFVTISLAIVGGIPVPLLLPRARLFPRNQVGGHSDAYAGAARDAHRGIRTPGQSGLQQHRGVAAPPSRKHCQQLRPPGRAA
jgi:multidrug efflux pump subunit AcrB